ncbi:hypothetical protein [Anaeromyxobacter oryzae]|uniref:O-antigen polymerase n=1 Tax=Anaeromyxobacter oryzae TaxID=2918170 RepID=A0ABM7X4V7_9BACT|nr:hypothetical protein [Anaeromyxobacter oryzae]BDG06818.1 hypothetical protein AMOR_58140 [Anaeromyxobacter oryzae]
MSRSPAIVRRSWFPPTVRGAAWAIIIAVFAISVWGVVVRPWHPATARMIDEFVNRGGRWSMVREGPLEHLEFAFWLIAMVIYAVILFRPARRHAVAAGAWTWFLPLLSFVAAGEESSWGEHYFGWRPTGLMYRANFQHETNLHNLDLGVLFGLDPSGWASRAAREVVSLGNPAFYAVAAAVWLVLPTLRERGFGTRWRLVRAVPVPRAGTRLLFASSIALFAFIDTFVGDVGEVIEFAIALVAMLAAMDLLETSNARASDAEASVTASDRQRAPHRAAGADVDPAVGA